MVDPTSRLLQASSIGDGSKFGHRLSRYLRPITFERQKFFPFDRISEKTSSQTYDLRLAHFGVFTAAAFWLVIHLDIESGLQ